MNNLVVFFLYACVAVVGCCPTASLVSSESSGMPVGEQGELEWLNDRANNTSLPLEQRCETIFSLFSRHVKPRITSREIAQVLPTLKWLEECEIKIIDRIGGEMPVEVRVNETLFSLRLPWQSNMRAPWGIYLTLSGGHNQKKRQLIDFLCGKAEEKQLTQFVLVHPKKGWIRSDSLVH